MSEANGKVCCNCKHCIRIREGGACYCKCEIIDKFLHYTQVMTGWCRHWAKEKKEVEE